MVRCYDVPKAKSLAALAPGRALHWYDYADLWLNFPLGKVLDYGCGRGTFLKRIAGRATTVCGVDIDPEQVEAANPVGQGQLAVIEPGEPFPFQDSSFDTVVILEVVEHVRDEREVLGEIARVLVPGGRLLLTTPHRGFLTFLDPGNFKFLAPRLHRLIQCRVLRRRDYYNKRFGPVRRAQKGMVADFTIDQSPWHRHYRYDDIRALTPAELETVAWAVYFPGFRALWALRLVLTVLTLGRAKRLPRPLSSLYNRLSRRESRRGDQLVVLFEKRPGNG